jgi:hypothetical protein
MLTENEIESEIHYSQLKTVKIVGTLRGKMYLIFAEGNCD